MNNNNLNKASLIRVIISAAALIIVIIGAIELIPNNIALAIAVALLCVSTIWNGVEAVLKKRIKGAVLYFAMAALLIILTSASLFL